MAPVRNPRASANVALPIARAPVRSPWAFAVPLPSTNAKLSGVLVQPEPMLKKPPMDKHDALAVPAPPSAAAAVNPVTNPDTAAPRTRPLARMSFEPSRRILTVLPPLRRNLDGSTVWSGRPSQAKSAKLRLIKSWVYDHRP